MIRNEAEYRVAAQRLKDERDRYAEQKRKLESMSLTEAEIKRVLDPVRSFHLQLEEEVQSYERLKRGDFGEFHNLRGIGQLLIALRISQGISQRDLAARLGVHESQISRDERNEYHGVTLDRASKVLDALGADLLSSVVGVVGATRAG